MKSFVDIDYVLLDKKNLITITIHPVTTTATLPRHAADTMHNK